MLWNQTLIGKTAAKDNFLSAGNTGVKVNCVCVRVCVFRHLPLNLGICLPPGQISHFDS